MGTYAQMWNYMNTNEDVFTKSNKLGIERVKESNGRYAFLMESSSIEYIIERDCNLAKVGGELDSKSYGIGMRKNSPYKKEINQAILRLQENGVLHKLKNKWWKQKGAKNCKVSSLFSYSQFYFHLKMFQGIAERTQRSNSFDIGKRQRGFPCLGVRNGLVYCHSIC